jgi:hypothetical protein
VSVTLAVELAPEPALLLLLVLAVLLLLLHAAIATAAAAAIVTTAAFLEPRMGSHLLMMPGFLPMTGARQTHSTKAPARSADVAAPRSCGSESFDKFSEIPL